MPQLISHWDGFGWQTPNVGDILEKNALDSAVQTGKLRGLATDLLHKFAELGTPIRLTNVEGFTSHSRYHLLPDKVGAMGSERLITPADLQKTLPTLLAEIGAQTGQLVSLKADESLTLFLRTSAHKPSGLYELLEQKAFLESPSYTTTVLGVNLEREVVLHDFSQRPHLLIVGSSSARLHLQLGIAVTLSLFNSPSYVRMALVGDDTSALRLLNGSPHILGNIVTNTAGLRRLLDGLVKHISGRKKMLEDQKADTVDAFNRLALSKKELKPLPRLVVLVDAVGLPDWRTSQDGWQVPLYQILTKGAEAGIHLVLSVGSQDPKQLPERLNAALPYRVIMRSALSPADQDPKLPLLFMDGIFKAADAPQPVPLELAAVAEVEVTRLVTYWQNMRNWRNTEMETKGQPTPTGNTGLLTLRSDMLPPAMQPEAEPQPVAPIIPDRIVTAAQSLAAYLGWLSVGPLRDVLNLTDEEAGETLLILRKLQVLEEGEGPIYRFLRLAEPPTEK